MKGPMAVSLEELDKAVNSLEEALHLHANSAQGSTAQKAFRDACLQRFEYCIELCWKTAMKQLGSTTLAAKPAVREMARNNLISNPEVWLEFIEARNETSHSYDDTVAAKVFQKIQIFYPEARLLINNMKKLT